jgi:hypothetical protein
MTAWWSSAVQSIDLTSGKEMISGVELVDAVRRSDQSTESVTVSR